MLLMMLLSNVLIQRNNDNNGINEIQKQPHEVF